MFKHLVLRNFARTALLAVLVWGATAPAAQATPHAGQSQQVGIISDTFVINGGQFPTTTAGPTGSFTDFTFTNVPVAGVSAATLAAYDTVLLNVASPGMGCNVNNLSASQKTDLVSFLNGGGKLIIYDSECPPQDYSWLPRPFTTTNPGALGGTGTVNIVEDNLLGTDTTGDPHFIDEALVGQQTDAVGDMNILTTQDPNICLHMTGTNAANQSGPTHVYYQSGSGFLIYNGFDVDFMSAATTPDASTPAGNIAKVWLQELQQPRNGQGLACAVAVVGIALAPQQATNAVGTSHTVTATVTDQAGSPRPNILVTFQLTGANAGATGTCNPASCQTDANGQVTFTYTGTTPGDDHIKACFVQAASQVCSAEATKTWTGPPPPTGARVEKQEVLAALSALLPMDDDETETVDDKAEKKIEEAIKHLEKSLEPELWVDDSHLTKKGEKVFHEEKEAVHKLMEIKSPPLGITDAIDALVAADRALARLAIDEATAAVGDAKKLADAEKEMAKAEEEIGKGHFDHAIQHYGHAWKKAQEALK